MLGVIGGMGPKATARLYLGLTDRLARAGDGALPELLIHSVAMTRRIEDVFVGGRVGPGSPELAAVRKLLDGAVERLVGAGATKIVMPCNTLQDELARTCRARDVEHVDMLDATVSAIVDAGVSRVLVLATTSTCRADLYGRRLHRHGIACVYPSAAAQAWLEGHIRGALDLRPPDADADLHGLLDGAERSWDGIVIGCTDLSGDLGPDRVSVPIFDSLECLAAAAAARALDPPQAPELSAHGRPPLRGYSAPATAGAYARR